MLAQKISNAWSMIRMPCKKYSILFSFQLIVLFFLLKPSLNCYIFLSIQETFFSTLFIVSFLICILNCADWFKASYFYVTVFKLPNYQFVYFFVWGKERMYECWIKNCSKVEYIFKAQNELKIKYLNRKKKHNTKTYHTRWLKKLIDNHKTACILE